MSQTTISSKNQITLPKSLLEGLGLKPSCKLMIKPNDHQIILEIQTKSLTQYYKGLGKSSWEKTGGGEKHLKKERASWK